MGIFQPAWLGNTKKALFCHNFFSSFGWIGWTFNVKELPIVVQSNNTLPKNPDPWLRTQKHPLNEIQVQSSNLLMGRLLGILRVWAISWKSPFSELFTYHCYPWSEQEFTRSSHGFGCQWLVETSLLKWWKLSCLREVVTKNSRLILNHPPTWVRCFFPRCRGCSFTQQPPWAQRSKRPNLSERGRGRKRGRVLHLTHRKVHRKFQETSSKWHHVVSMFFFQLFCFQSNTVILPWMAISFISGAYWWLLVEVVAGMTIKK